MRALTLAWALFRVPAALVILFLLRDQITAALVDPMELTHRIIEIASTPLARFAFFLTFAGLLASLWSTGRRWSEWTAYWITILAVTLLMFVLFEFTGTSRKMGGLIVLLLATNLMPNRLLRSILPNPKLEQTFLAASPGVAEIFFFQRYLGWIAEVWTGRARAPSYALTAALPGILLVSAATAVVVRTSLLVSIEQTLRMPPSARIVARGDFNWIEIDSTRQHLLVTGHGAPRILKFGLADLDKAPAQSSVETGGAQGFVYDPVAGEVYVYRIHDRQLLYFDAATLALKRSAPVPDLAPGDLWIAVDAKTDTLALMSEADEQIGAPMLVLDRATGAIRDRRDLEVGNVLHVGRTSRLYFSFFRRRSVLMIYDLNTFSIAAEVPTPPKVDRMAFREDANEILLTSPTQSRILCYDADTLRLKGTIDGMFGVRALAIDATRNLLISGSLATGQVEAIDLASGRSKWRYYLGPWLRTIALDIARGVALVSSNGALYELRYDDLE